MKKVAFVLLLLAFTMLTGIAFARDYDAEWVSQCMQDNRREGVDGDTVMTYCKCMNDKMSDDETESISDWENSHPDEMAECEAEAGWD